MNNFTTSFTVDQSPEAVFAAINNVRGWWSQAVVGDTTHPDSVFYYHYKDVHRCTLKVAELIAGEKVVWEVLHNKFNFIKDNSEWENTNIVFEILPHGDTTEVRFTHAGLVPAYECYDICSNAWEKYITGSLRDLLVAGVGQPNPPEDHASHQEELVIRAREMSRNLQTA